MKGRPPVLRKCYDWILRFADHPRAVWILAAVSFAESSFFPLPPDPLYYAMLLKRREQSWTLAWVCTITSVVGGWFGYAIGFGLYESVGVWIIDTYGLAEGFKNFQASVAKWGFWIIALKGLTPIPYKIVTIACGALQYDFTEFTIASMIARGSRFFMLAALFLRFGPSIKDYIDENLTFVTLAALGALIGGFGLIYAFG